MSDQANRSTSMWPTATYRLQFQRNFTLRDAAGLVPYLAFLGVSHIYASPLLTAMPGSMHGYDMCDPTRMNPEIGTESDLEALAGLLHDHGMGLVLDIVPNHMGIGGRHNPWWWDVLKNDRASRFAGVFDIDWDAPGHDGKILLHVLGDSYQNVLSSGGFQAMREHDGFVLKYSDHEFPLVAQTLPAGKEDLDACLKRQHYRLDHWRNGDSKLNYRRFFTITSLVGVRVEDPEVFRLTHEVLLRWYDRGWIDGFRVDHPDGLRDPQGYLDRLRRHAPDAWITVEKILTGDEALPADWPVAGTTGYDFMNREIRVLTDEDGEPAITELYETFTAENAGFGEIAREAKREVLRDSMAAEVGHLLRLMEGGGDRDSLIQFIACFPVYRSYVKAGNVSPADRIRIEEATRLANEQGADPGTIGWILHALLADEGPPAAEEFTARLQQLTGPATAKGLEDRAFYRFNRFVALNEVGGDPGCFATTVDSFHRSSIGAVAGRSGSMLATSTHDTKRGEDVRARLCVLAEIPDLWAAAVRDWSAMNECHRAGEWPDRNAEYLFYQILVGAWPLGADRAAAYMEKAAREAATHTSWIDVNSAYEAALDRFIRRCLADKAFTSAIDSFVAPLLDAAWINSLALTLLKLTAPGIPDIYQGAELWELSLVDPDNRRAVDFELRRRLIGQMEALSPEDVWRRRSGGLPKLWLIRRALGVRRARPSSFVRAAYQPIAARGTKARHALAFLRGADVIAVMPRLPLGLVGEWLDTRLELPPGEWHNALTDETISGGERPVAKLLDRFPVALLVRQTDTYHENNPNMGTPAR